MGTFLHFHQMTDIRIRFRARQCKMPGGFVEKFDTGGLSPD